MTMRVRKEVMPGRELEALRIIEKVRRWEVDGVLDEFASIAIREYNLNDGISQDDFESIIRYYTVMNDVTRERVLAALRSGVPFLDATDLRNSEWVFLCRINNGGVDNYSGDIISYYDIGRELRRLCGVDGAPKMILGSLEYCISTELTAKVWLDSHDKDVDYKFENSFDSLGHPCVDCFVKQEVYKQLVMSENTEVVNG